MLYSIFICSTFTAKSNKVKFTGVKISDEQFKFNVEKYGSVIQIIDLGFGTKVVEYNVMEEAEVCINKIRQKNVSGLGITYDCKLHIYIL